MNESGGMISRRLGQEMAMITNRPPQAEEILGRTNEQSTKCGTWMQLE